MEINLDDLATTHSIVARQRVMTDLKLLARDAEDLLKATAHDVSDRAREVRARVTAALERAKATCAEVEAHAITTARSAARKTDLAIRAHPYESLGAAFGVGLLVGVLVMYCSRNGKSQTDI